MTNPKVSFIYCNYNAAKLIEPAIRSVMETASFVNYEIIVIDDVSTDNSVEMIKTKFPDVHLIVNSKTLWSEASFNKAFHVAKGDFFYLMGTDTILYQNTLEPMLSYMDKHPEIHAITSKVFYPDGRFQQNACRDHNLTNAVLNFTFLGQIFPRWKQKLHEHFIYKGWDWDQSREIDSSGFTNLLIRKSAIEQAGFLDTGYKQYFSENDLCLRIRRNGGKVFYLAEGKVVHHLRGTVSKSNIKQIAQNYEHDCFYYFRKNHGYWASLSLKLLILITNVLLSIKNRKRQRIFERFLVEPEKNN